MRLRKPIGITIVFFLILLVFIPPAYAEITWLGYNARYCEIEINYPNYVILVCSFEILKQENGFSIYINTSETTFNKVIIERYYSLFSWSWKLSAQFTHDRSHPDGGTVEINLPLWWDYGVSGISAWNLTIGWIDSSGQYTFTNHIINESTCPDFHCQAVKTNLRPSIIQLKPITSQSPPVYAPKPPEWYDIQGWIAYLGYLVGILGQYVGAGLQVFLTVMGYFVQALPFILAIIPVHIIVSFIESPDKGVDTIHLYTSIGKKIVELFMKVVHAIIELIGAVKPT